MHSHKALIGLLVVLCLYEIEPKANSQTVFTKTFFTSVPEMNQQREAQKRRILDIINSADGASSPGRFGMEFGGVRLGLFILEPDNATTTAIHAVAVIRNESRDPISFWGLERDVLSFYAIGEGKQLVDRTQKGELYSGTPLLRNGIPMPREGNPPKKVTLSAGGQMVYEINIAELFKIEAGKEVLVTAVGRLKDAQFTIIREVRSESFAVIPKEKHQKPSLFDGPHIPAEYLKYATNRPPREIAPTNPLDAAKTMLRVTQPKQPVVVNPSIPSSNNTNGNQRTVKAKGQTGDKANGSTVSTNAASAVVTSPASQPRTLWFVLVSLVLGTLLAVILLRASRRRQ